MKRVISVCLLPLSTSCVPAIEHFTASPQVTCPGDPITLDWRVTGARGNVASLSVTDGSATGAFPMTVPAESHVSTGISAPTTFRLSATNENGTNHRDLNVSQMRPGDPLLHFSASDPHSCPEIQASTPLILSVPPALTSSRLRVTNVSAWASGDAQIINVSGPAVGAPAVGSWIVNWQYIGPQCPPPDATNAPPAPPQNAIINLVVDVSCA